MTEDHRAVHDIRAVVADHERGLNTNDPDLLGGHYRERSWAVGVTGAEIEGAAAIRTAMAAALAPGGFLADQHVRYRPGEVELLGSDVAICHVYATATDTDGRPLGPDPAMVALYVMQRVGDRWLVVARQNTLVTP